MASFSMGQIVMTRGVNDLAADNEEFAKFVTDSLERHVIGDWGDMDPKWLMRLNMPYFGF